MDYQQALSGEPHVSTLTGDHVQFLQPTVTLKLSLGRSQNPADKNGHRCTYRITPNINMSAAIPKAHYGTDEATIPR